MVAAIRSGGRTRKHLFSVLTGQYFLSKGVGFIFTQEIAERKRNEPTMPNDEQDYSLF